MQQLAIENSDRTFEGHNTACLTRDTLYSLQLYHSDDREFPPFLLAMQRTRSVPSCPNDLSPLY
jgi:hypothetical protein